MTKSAAKVNTDRKHEFAIHTLRVARKALREELHGARRLMDTLNRAEDWKARLSVEDRISRIKAETDDLTAAIVALLPTS